MGGNYNEIAREVLSPFESNLLGVEEDSIKYKNMFSTLVKTLKISGCSQWNKLELFTQGEAFFREMWAEIDGATERIWLETYIYVFDFVGETTIKKLSDAAKRGVQVILVVDSFGTWGNLSVENFSELIQNGGFVYVFNRHWTSLLRFRSPFIRDHRKVILCDKHAFIGGMNIENVYSTYHSQEEFDNDESLLTPEEFKATFRDTMVKVTGHSVAYLETTFKETYENVEPLIEYGKVPLGFEIHEEERAHGFIFDQDTEFKEEEMIVGLMPTTSSVGDDIENRFPCSEKLFVQVTPSHPKRGRKSLQKAVVALLDSATDHVYITSPYFIPPLAIKKAILKAADRGVDVKILTSGLCDVPFFKMTAESNYGPYLAHENVELFEFYDRILHSKTLSVDGIYSSLGSYNFEYTSFKTHMEIGLHVFNPEFSEKIEENFWQDSKNATFVENETWRKRPLWKKIVGRFLYYVMRVLVK